MKTAIFILCKETHSGERFYELSPLLGSYGIPIVVVSDADIDDQPCFNQGYHHAAYSEFSEHIKKPVIALDKALWLLCSGIPDHKHYDFVWLIEDDCFFTDAAALANLQQYTNYDLVTCLHRPKIDSVPDWHWARAFKLMQGPYFSSMSCCVGLSRKMLDCIGDFARKNNTLVHAEIMFNTLAAQNGFSICTPPELQTMAAYWNWCLDDFLLFPNNVFHPVKQNHKAIRNIISMARGQNYKPANKLPDVLRDVLSDSAD
jgi:hypothetical protein